MITVAIANQKGGVGKTTIARNLTIFAAEKKLRVLAADFDPQRNFSSTYRAVRERNLGDDGMGVKSLTSSSLFKSKISKHKPLDCGDGIGLIAADRELVDVGRLPIKDLTNPRDALAAVAQDYDLCVIDTAPTLGNPLYAALIAADYVVCPCTMDQDAIEGISDLFEDISRVQQLGWNSNLVTLGLLANRVNKRRTFDMNTLAELRDELGGAMLDGVLYDRAATQYAKDRPVWRASSGESQLLAAKEMKAMCGLLMQRIGL